MQHKQRGGGEPEGWQGPARRPLASRRVAAVAMVRRERRKDSRPTARPGRMNAECSLPALKPADLSWGGVSWAALISSRPAPPCAVSVCPQLSPPWPQHRVEAWPFSLWGHPHSGLPSSRWLGDSGGICHNVATWAPWTLAAGRILATPGLGCPGGFQACFVCRLAHGRFQSRQYPLAKA